MELNALIQSKALIQTRPWKIANSKSDSGHIGFMERGSIDGNEVDDWLQAEAEIKRTKQQ